jgi:hypothetical protein
MDVEIVFRGQYQCRVWCISAAPATGIISDKTAREEAELAVRLRSAPSRGWRLQRPKKAR